ADRPGLDFRLGQLVLRQGDLPRAIHLLARSVDQQPLDQRAGGYALLVQAYLALPRPDIDAALDANQRQSDLLEDDDLLGRCWLQRGELLVAKGARAEALKTLERIGSKARRELRLQARLLQTQCCEAEGLWNRAIGLWLELMPDAAHVPGGQG